MSEKPIIRFPNGSKGVWRSVRFAFYLRVIVRLSPVVASSTYLSWSLMKDAFLNGLQTEYAIRLAIVWAFSFPCLVMIKRVLFGTNEMRGMIAIADTTRRWRATWSEIESTSEVAKTRALQSKAVFALPDSREQFDDLHPHNFYQTPEELILDLPGCPNYVTYGNLNNQPIQAIDAGSAVAAASLVRRIGSVIAGRVLCKELPIVAFKSESATELRLTFLADIQTGPTFHGFVWLTVHLEVDGTMVGGFVETVRTLFVERTRFTTGRYFWGDAQRAKYLGTLLWDAVLVYSPFCFLMAPRRFWHSCLDLYDGRLSGSFFSIYRPEAGDSVDLFLIGEAGSESDWNKGFVSSVESVRNGLVREVHQVVGMFSGVVA